MNTRAEMEKITPFPFYYSPRDAIQGVLESVVQGSGTQKEAIRFLMELTGATEGASYRYLRNYGFAGRRQWKERTRG